MGKLYKIQGQVCYSRVRRFTHLWDNTREIEKVKLYCIKKCSVYQESYKYFVKTHLNKFISWKLIYKSVFAV